MVHEDVDAVSQELLLAFVLLVRLVGEKEDEILDDILSHSGEVLGDVGSDEVFRDRLYRGAHDRARRLSLQGT